MDPGHLSTHALNQIIGLSLGHMPLHTLKHIVRDMLEGYIEVLTHIRFLSHHAKQIPREMGRIGIVQTDPFHTGNICHLLNQFGDMLFTVNVNAIISQLLGNDIKLLRAVLDQLAHFIQDLLHRPTLMAPRYQRNSAIGTMTVTALRNFHVGIMVWGRDMPLPLQKLIAGARPRSKVLRQILQQFLIIELPIPPVDLWYFFL